MLAAMHMLAALGGQPLPLSEFAAKFERYVASGEINTTVADPAANSPRPRRHSPVPARRSVCKPTTSTA